MYKLKMWRERVSMWRGDIKNKNGIEENKKLSHNHPLKNVRIVHKILDYDDTQ